MFLTKKSQGREVQSNSVKALAASAATGKDSHREDAMKA